jgi:hypothetical protein
MLIGTLSGTADAQDGWSFQNRPITLYTAGTPGGGYDFYARLLARHLGRHLPGNPSIVVKNMPGAGGVVLANHLQARAARDGTELAALEHGTAFTSLLTSVPGRLRSFAVRLAWQHGTVHADCGGLAHGPDLFGRRPHDEADNRRNIRRGLDDLRLSAFAQRHPGHQDESDRGLPGLG